MSVRCFPSSPPAAGKVGRRRLGYASREAVLEAFGLQERDLDTVRSLGEAARRPPQDPEDVEASDSEGEVF